MIKRDIELLSAYLDGELKSSDLARVEARLKTDPELASVLSDIRAARTLLRKLPSRKAPRNFTLTRKMVGKNPPLPRAYPYFRLATTVATLLFFFTFSLTFVGSQLAQPMNYGMGGGGGGEPESFASGPAAEEPLPPEPSIAMDAMPTETTPSEDSARVIETPSQKDNGEEAGPAAESQLQTGGGDQSASETPSPSRFAAWQVGFAVAALLGALFMGLMRVVSARRWK